MSEPLAIARDTGADTRHYRVLLVDDQVSFLELAATLLAERPELRVVGAVTIPGEAERVLRATSADVAVIDVLMPDLTGFELTRRLLEAQPGLRVLLVSAYDHEEWRTLARSVGAVGFLAKKAFSGDTVVEMLARDR